MRAQLREYHFSYAGNLTARAAVCKGLARALQLRRAYISPTSLDVAGAGDDRHDEDAIRHREAGGRAHLEYWIPVEEID